MLVSQAYLQRIRTHLSLGIRAVSLAILIVLWLPIRGRRRVLLLLVVAAVPLLLLMLGAIIAMALAAIVVVARHVNRVQ